jgi:predicted nucleotide-binding protein
LFLFASDDKRVMRGKEESVTRDNVIFETGIAIGLLGKERVFIIAEKDTALPKDLDGLTVFKFILMHR